MRISALGEAKPLNREGAGKGCDVSSWSSGSFSIRSSEPTGAYIRQHDQ